MAKRQSRPSFQSYLEFGDDIPPQTVQDKTVDKKNQEELLSSISDWVVLDDTTGKPCKAGASGSVDKPGNEVEDLLGLWENNESESTDSSNGNLPETDDQATRPCQRHPYKAEEKLCGYLSKFKMGSRRGRLFKKRWFVFSDASCQLLYYRTTEDLIPLGEIDVSRASLTFDVDPGSKSTIFKIRSGGQTICLEAPDKQTMMYWLQELQKKRRLFSRRKTKLVKNQEQPLTIPVNYPMDYHAPSGLASLVTQLTESGDHSSTHGMEMLAQVDTPLDTVGESAAGTGNRAKLKDLSFANWRTELRNVVRNLQFKKVERSPSTRSPTPSPLCTPSEEQHPTSAPAAEQSGAMAAFKERLVQLRPKSFTLENDVVPSHTCNNCKQLRHELSSVEDELEATRQVVKVLQKQGELLQTQIQTVSQWHCSPTERQELGQLYDKDKRIVELEHLLGANQQDAEIIKHNMSCAVRESQGLQEQLTLYKESTQKKDEMIMNLSSKLLELEGGADHWHGASASALEPSQGQRQPTPGLNWKELESLRDRSHGLEKQNQFLNSEILELQQLRQDDEARERQLFVKSTEMEAKYYQVKSKYLSMLRELNNGKKGDDEGPYPHDLVCRLLQEAIDMDTEAGLPYAHTSLIGSYPQYDKYGFLLLPLSMTEDASLEAQVDDLQRRSDELTSLNLDKEISHQVKWENYLVGLGSRELHRSPELKALVRGGVPPQHRPKIWRVCIDWWIGKYREGYGADYYDKLKRRANTPNSKVNPAFKQIELDLLRTLPNNKHFENAGSEGVGQLRNVLQAYIQHNPNIGYCQGLNRLVGIALLFLHEEDAFWCLVAIAEMIMPTEYYSTTMMDAQVDQRVLKDLLLEKLPKLSAHLEKHSVDLSLFTFNWFLTIFVDNIPVDTFLRVWDTFLYEGNKVLFRYSLAIVKYREEDILTQTDTMSIQNYLRTLGDNATNINAISQIAFHELNPFPIRHIAYRRQVHTQHVKAELAQLNALRQRHSDASATHRDQLSDDEPLAD